MQAYQIAVQDRGYTTVNHRPTESDGSLQAQKIRTRFDVLLFELLRSYINWRAPSAGVTMKPENVEPFKVKFAMWFPLPFWKNISRSELTVRLRLGRLMKFFRILRQLAFRSDRNMNPIFRSNRLQNGCGAGQHHLRLRVVKFEPRKSSCDRFNQSTILCLIRGDQFTIEENTERRVNLQLNVKDINPV